MANFFEAFADRSEFEHRDNFPLILQDSGQLVAVVLGNFAAFITDTTFVVRAFYAANCT